MASPFLIDHPSPPLITPTTSQQSPRSPGSGLEAFPDFPSSPLFNSSPSSQHRSHAQSNLDVPGTNDQPKRPNRPFRSPSQRLPPTALLPSSRNTSHNDLSSPVTDREDQPQQRLPRAIPAPSLSGPSVRPSSMTAGLLRGSTASIGRLQPNAEELKSESLWADMQRTLADVELSAMNSSHLFNAPHSQALEKLREMQLSLAQAWARSEADETGGQESEDDFLDTEPKGDIQPSALGPGAMKGTRGKGGKDVGTKAGERRDRQGSGSSNIGKDLEEETERDIRLARRRREANDHYFSQVNRGVLDVVARLDEVASAMKMVEKESRAVWDEMGGDGSTTASGTELDGDTDASDKPGPSLMRQLTKMTSTTGTGTGSGTELSDSPISPKKPQGGLVKSDKERETKKSPKDKGR